MNRSLSALTRAGVLTAAVSVALAGPAVAEPNIVLPIPGTINPIPGINGQPRGLPRLPGPTQAIFQMTGMDSPNRTQHANVLGTDLGIMWDDGNGAMITAFGDSAGLGIPNLFVGSPWAWSSQVLLRTSVKDPSRGIPFHNVVTNPLPSPKIPGIEISLIPTAGVSVGGVQYMSMMSVRAWGEHGNWETNFSTLAASGDGGQTWAPLTNTRRANVDGHHNFQQNAFLKDSGYVYRYGTPAGRQHPGFVSRVPEADIVDIDAYEYWDGAEWKPDVKVAAPIVGDVSELSVMWNDHLGEFIMLTTDQHNSVVMRTSAVPEGPWSEPQTLVDGPSLPSSYAPMIFPYQTGSDLYFLLSVYNQYNVLLMKTPL